MGRGVLCVLGALYEGVGSRGADAGDSGLLRLVLSRKDCVCNSGWR